MWQKNSREADVQTLNEDLKSGQFRTVYLLFGEEGFLKKSYKNRMKEAITGGDTMRCV